MKKFVALLVVSTLSMGLANQAYALAPFKKAFTEKYVTKHKSEDFQKAAKKASCNVCHVSKQKKTVHNAYGKLLNKLIEGNANARIKAAKKKGKEDGDKETAKVLKELEAAFEKVAKEKSDGKDSPTFGALIKEGKLPVEVDKAIADHKEELKKKKDGDDKVKDADDKA